MGCQESLSQLTVTSSAAAAVLFHMNFSLYRCSSYHESITGLKEKVIPIVDIKVERCLPYCLVELITSQKLSNSLPFLDIFLHLFHASPAMLLGTFKNVVALVLDLQKMHSFLSI